MAKKNRQIKTSKVPERAHPEERIASLGWTLIAAGASCVVIGFFVLSCVDRMGRNWAATAAPLLILGGYALIGLGLFVPASAEGGETVSSPSSPARL